MSEMEKNEVLKIYKSVGALLEGHFILSSGLHSKVYLQSALIFSDPVIAKVICKKLVELIKTKINRYNNFSCFGRNTIGLRNF